MITTVLGTTFTIKKSGDSALIVDLLKGKLNVAISESTPQSILLAENERAVYVRANRHFYKQPIIPVNTLSFHGSNFEEIASQFKKAFGITIINQSNKTKWLFTGEFMNATAKEIIESICLVKKCTYQINGDTILIK
jgi:hypothetical protein